MHDLGFKWQIAMYSAAAVSSLLRIRGGQHFFSDVVAGAFVGISIPHLIYGFLHKDEDDGHEMGGFHLNIRANEIVASYLF